MTVNDPAVIQELVICAPRRLPDVARKLGLATSTASVVRDHWVRLITSRCVRCNALVEGDACPKCNTTRQTASEFLQKVKPKDLVLRRYCTHCGCPFYYNAGYVLSMFKKNGVFKPSTSCDRCRARNTVTDHTPAKRKKAKTKKVKAVQAKKPVQEKSVPKKPKRVKVKKPAAKKPAPKESRGGSAPSDDTLALNRLIHRDGGASLTHNPFEALKLKK